MIPDTAPTQFALVSAEHGTFRLQHGCNEIGRAHAATVALRDRSISQRHAVLEVLADKKILIRDLASKNGTFVNGKAASSAEVRPGDQIRFGRFAFRLESLDPGDGWLAVKAPDRSKSTTVGKSDHGTVVTRTEAATLESHRLQTFVTEVVRSTARGELSAALGSLTRQLDVESALLLSFDGPGEPRIIANAGPLETAARSLADLQEPQSKQSRLSDSTYATGEDSGNSYTVATKAGSHGRLALIVSKSWPLESPGGWLVSTTLSLIDLGLGTEPAISTGGRTATKLTFPENYVRCSSHAMTRLYTELQLASDSELPVLITGETGVGKESIATTLHKTSKRASERFLTVNCAAIPSDLLEAELFGVASGVATGVAQRTGKLEAANGGTILLDEIGEMKRDLQVKLLRALEERSIEPLGGSARPLDIRIVASTNRDLRRDMSSGRFRSDLYYRLAGFILEVPPLRHRKSDIPLLVEHFFAAGSQRAQKTIQGITYAALEALVNRDWPGNVRELRYAVLRAVHATPDGGVIDSKRIDHLDNMARSPKPETAEWRLPPADLRLDRLERAAIQEALRRSEGNQSEAAQSLGISRSALRRRMLKHEIQESD